jgi:hypothetical protein
VEYWFASGIFMVAMVAAVETLEIQESAVILVLVPTHAAAVAAFAKSYLV